MVTYAVLIAWAAVLAWHDWRLRRLPNWLLFNGVLVGAVHWAAYGVMPFGAPLAEGAFTLVLAVVLLWPFYRLGWMGAGDVKLCATIGWLGGAEVLAGVFLAGSAIGGLLGLAILSPRLSHWLSGPATEARQVRRIPFGAALGLAFAGWALARMA